jgi:hypothetical protein
MIKIKPILSVAILVTGLANIALALSWDNGAGDNLWSNAVNWSKNQLPTITSSVDVAINTAGPVINSSTTATGQVVRIGGSSGANLIMSGGTLNVGEWLMVGTDVAARPGIFTMDSGTVNLGSTISGNGHLWIGYISDGTFTMNGGVINVPGRFGLGYSGGMADVYLYGGTINAAYFSMAPTSTIEITNGTLIINGDQRNTITDYVNNHLITAFNGTGVVVASYNQSLDKTTVSAYFNTDKPILPNPANNASDVNVNSDLIWTAGTNAASHNVYFGTSEPLPLVSNQTQTTFDPGQLQLNTIYYWRIDEVSSMGEITTGDAWSFNTTAGLAKNPDPVSGASNLSLDTQLNWTSGLAAISHDVYFGTDVRDVRNAQRLAGDLNGDGQVNYEDFLILTQNWLTNPQGSVPYAGINEDNIVDFIDYIIFAQDWQAPSDPIFKGNTTGNSFTPENLEVCKTYYWRVDEVCGSEVRQGNIWSFTTTAFDSNYSLYGKVMCGYQGWFACPGDNSGRGGWVHWSTNSTYFDYTHLKVEMWPDTSEYAKTYASGFTLGNPPYNVFSSYDANTVMVHFKWMQQYGIDGVFVQRFGSDLGAKSFLNTVLSNVKIAANKYGRKYAVMYDFTNYNPSNIVELIESDWTELENTYGISTDPQDRAFIRHNGKPVIAIYGIGWLNQGYADLSKVATLIQWFKDKGFAVVVGVNNDWRTNQDINYRLCVNKADIILPWNVGRYDSTNIASYANSKWVPDITYCSTIDKDYMVCIFPGFSWHNWNTGDFNDIPRNGGQFLWDQLYQAKTIRANMIYVAMFDEVDESTAIFKVSNNPPPPSGSIEFLTLGGLPSDEYLWLTGQAGRALRNEIPVTPTRPAR